jgi:hypothetical protein
VISLSAHWRARRSNRAVSAMLSLIGAMPGGHGWPGSRRRARLRPGRPGGRPSPVPVPACTAVFRSAGLRFPVGLGGAAVWGEDGDGTVEGVAESGVAELGEGGQGGVAADAVPRASLARSHRCTSLPVRNVPRRSTCGRLSQRTRSWLREPRPAPTSRR